MRGIGDGLDSKGTWCCMMWSSNVCHSHPHHILRMLEVKTSYGGAVHKILQGQKNNIFSFLRRSHTFLTSDLSAK
jgi:hypothetical protein